MTRASIWSKLQKTSISLFLLLCLGSCHRVSREHLEPEICYTVADTYLKRMPSPFPPLTPHETQSDWGREYTIGLAFANELDLYRAITAFKRSEILLKRTNSNRIKEIQYNILLSYYMGKRYEEVIDTFNHSNLRHVDNSFPTYHDLLVMLYESYDQTREILSRDVIMEHLKEHYPETAERLCVSTALQKADFPALATYNDNPYVDQILTCYDSQKKSIAKAELFNAMIPGAGYLYVGQKQSALTALILNGLFIGAATFFFLDGNIAAGAIFTGFEAGWYFGGIYGAGEAAKTYNRRTYEDCANPVMTQERLFPILSLKYGF